MNDQVKVRVSRRRFLGASAAATALCSAPRIASAQQKALNLLAWIGYQETDIVRPFEEQYGVRLNVKTYVGGDQMFSLLMASKGIYDVVLMDPEYVQKLRPVGRLRELNLADYDVSHYLPPFRQYPPVWNDNKMYGLMVRYGFNGLVYNTSKISEEAASSYKTAWDPALKGRVGIWDWYLPSMGVISRYLGYKDPYALTEAQFSKLVETLFSLKPNVGAVFSDFSTMLASLASEQIWIVVSGGDWVGAALKFQGHPIAWSIPKEGGIIWSECLTIPTDSRNPDLAKQYIQYMATGKAQSLLTWRQANTSQVPNTDAWRFMTDKQKAALQITNEQDALGLLSRASVRQLPASPPEERWQEAWQQFKGRA